MCHTCINISVQYILFSIGEVNVRVDEVVGAESTSDHKEMENSNQVYMYIPLSVSHTVEVHNTHRAEVYYTYTCTYFMYFPLYLNLSLLSHISQ